MSHKVSKGDEMREKGNHDLNERNDNYIDKRFIQKRVRKRTRL